MGEEGLVLVVKALVGMDGLRWVRMGWDVCEGGTGTDLDGIGWYGRSGVGEESLGLGWRA